MTLKFLPLLIILFTASDCNKHMEDLSQNTPTIFGSWKLIDWYDEDPRDINQDGNASTDLFSQWNGCKKEGVLILEKDFTGKIVYLGKNENPKCPPGFSTNDSFALEPWEIDKEGKYFTLNGDDYSDSYEIIDLTHDMLILKGSGFFTCCDPAISYYTGGFLKFQRI